MNENAAAIAENIQRIFENHQKYIWEKNRDTSKLKPVKYCHLRNTLNGHLKINILKLPRFVNNAEWYNKISITQFLSTAGRHFRVGTMMGRNSVQSRLNSETGISFTEFSYQVLQAYDWLHLLRAHNCRFQVRKKFDVFASIPLKVNFNALARLVEVIRWAILSRDTN